MAKAARQDGETAFQMGGKGKLQGKAGNTKGKRKPASDDPDPKSVRFTPAEDTDGNHAGYVSETEYDNSGNYSADSSYKAPTTAIHTSAGDAEDHLAKTFGEIDSDETLDATEKRRKKAKTSMQVGKA